MQVGKQVRQDMYMNVIMSQRTPHFLGSKIKMLLNFPIFKPRVKPMYISKGGTQSGAGFIMKLLRGKVCMLTVK